MTKAVDPLPDNDNEFWKVGEHEAKNRVHTLQLRNCERGLHTFERRGHDGVCIKCTTGFPLGTGADVVDGHIYINGTKVI